MSQPNLQSNAVVDHGAAEAGNAFSYHPEKAPLCTDDQDGQPTDRVSKWIGRSPQPWAVQLLALGGFFLVNTVVAYVGAVTSINSKDFYEKLDRPPWAPPAWLFGPAWTILYFLIAVSAWLVWRSDPKGFATKVALSVYFAQLVPNMLWTWFFFDQKSGAAAFIDILVLLAMIVVNLYLFSRQSELAATLFYPYILWISFATALTLDVWQRNPTILG